MVQKEQTKEFQAEIKQLLDIVINSLYTNKEIFLRELISNAADALEKQRYLALTSGQSIDTSSTPEISISTDDVAHTLTISDTGIGMTEDDLIKNLGTIAHSGSKAFLKELAEGKGDLSLIGQFGVGFYSAFMVAKKVTLYTYFNDSSNQGFIWESTGAGSYTIKSAEGIGQGTRIVLTLKSDAKEFSNPDNIKRIIEQYSNFVAFPIKLNGEVVNTIRAIWVKNKNEITEGEYNEFYKFTANAFDEPLYRLNFTADAPLSINALLYIPKENFESFGFGRFEPGVSLYCQKVLIQEKSTAILPEWLRFMKGVVDSEELPLNISRETMQDNALVAKLNKVITGRIIRFLKEQAGEDKQKYQNFWKKFGIFIKEGTVSDFERRKDLAELLRFETSNSAPGELVSLKEYCDKMQPEQEEIYYLNGTSRESIEKGPYLEIFKQKGIEVIYTYDAADDYVLSQIGSYKEKQLISADQDDIKLTDVTAEDVATSLAPDQVKELSEWIKQVLGERISEARESKRLTDSPAMVLSSQGTPHSMQKIMQMMHKDLPKAAHTLEFNPRHDIIKKLYELKETKDSFAQIALEQIYDNALIVAGLLTDQKGFVDRIYTILDRALK